MSNSNKSNIHGRARCLDASRFDNEFGHVQKREKLWGAPAIATALGVSVDKVYSMATNPAIPVYKPEGAGYFAYRAELEIWLRTKPSA